MAKLKRISCFSLLSLLLICSASASAQWQKKPSAEWNGDDIKKLMNDSPWVKKLDLINVGKAGYPSGAGSNTRSREGNDPSVKLNNDPTVPKPEAISDRSYTSIYVRLVSAKPILEAIKQNKVLPDDDERQVQELKALANAGPGDLIIVAVGLETLATPPKPYGSGSVTGSISPEVAKETFLEVKGGQRIPLYAYKPGKTYNLLMGSFFVFKRVVDGKPIITADSGEFRFHTKMRSAGKSVDIDAKYKTKDLLYDGKLEF